MKENEEKEEIRKLIKKSIEKTQNKNSDSAEVYNINIGSIIINNYNCDRNKQKTEKPDCNNEYLDTFRDQTLHQELRLIRYRLTSLKKIIKKNPHCKKNIKSFKRHDCYVAPCLISTVATAHLPLLSQIITHSPSPITISPNPPYTLASAHINPHKPT